MNKDDMVMQAMLTIFQYASTGRFGKALSLMSNIGQMEKTEEAQKIFSSLTGYIFKMQNEHMNIDLFEQDSLSENFGTYMCSCSYLKDKVVQVVCDQGMGDLINLFRYVKILKDKYECKIYLNSYSFYNELEDFIKLQKHVIEDFTYKPVKSDYVVNIMSLPSIINDIHKFGNGVSNYPVHFEKNMEHSIPDHRCMKNVDFEKSNDGIKKIGIALECNIDNEELYNIKRVPYELLNFNHLKNVEFYSLQPNVIVPDWVHPMETSTIYETLKLANNMDFVMSVDTAVLHLCGSFDIPTVGLIPFDCDPRWGSGNKTVWYPSVELFRQNEDLDWIKVIDKASNYIENKLSLV